jgi:F0F1-type ATP synthase assembly protein I
MPKENIQNNQDKSFSALSLAWSLGWNIALPLVVLALAGRWADKKFDTSPWFLLVGAMLAIGISSFLVFKKVMEINKSNHEYTNKK